MVVKKEEGNHSLHRRQDRDRDIGQDSISNPLIFRLPPIWFRDVLQSGETFHEAIPIRGCLMALQMLSFPGVSRQFFNSVADGPPCMGTTSTACTALYALFVLIFWSLYLLSASLRIVYMITNNIMMLHRDSNSRSKWIVYQIFLYYIHHQNTG